MATFGTFVSGQVLTAAELNTAGEWQSYTPTWTQSATITKTVNWARYSQLNKLVTVSIKMTSSSAGTSNNKILVGLPINASSNSFLMGTMVFDTGTYIADYFSIYESASTIGFVATSSSISSTSNTLRFGQSNSGSNATVASGNIIYVNLVYEAA